MDDGIYESYCYMVYGMLVIILLDRDRVLVMMWTQGSLVLSGINKPCC